MKDILDFDQEALDDLVDSRIRYIGILRGIVCLKLIGIVILLSGSFISIIDKIDLSHPSGYGDASMFLLIFPVLLLLYYNLPQAFNEIRLDPACFDKQPIRRIGSVICFAFLMVCFLVSFLFVVANAGGFMIPLFFCLFVTYVFLWVIDLKYLARNKGDSQ